VTATQADIVPTTKPATTNEVQKTEAEKPVTVQKGSSK
jgi:hypothetical protein